MAELLPQRPVLAEGLQGGRGLPQVDDVTGVGQLVDDGVLGVERQVVEGEAAGGELARQSQG